MAADGVGYRGRAIRVHVEVEAGAQAAMELDMIRVQLLELFIAVERFDTQRRTECAAAEAGIGAGFCRGLSTSGFGS